MKLLIYILAIGLMSFKDYGNTYPFIKHCSKCHTVCSLNLTQKNRPPNDLSYVGKRYHEQQLRKKLTVDPFHVRFKGTEKELNILLKWLGERK
jgi:hypothetical protein